MSDPNTCDCNLNIMRSCERCRACFWHEQVAQRRGMWLDAVMHGLAWVCDQCKPAEPTHQEPTMPEPTPAPTSEEAAS